VFKKAFQIVVTFGLLVGMYQAYIVAFAAVANRIGRERGPAPFLVDEIEPRFALVARALAVECLGKDSFAAQKDLRISFYDAERGFFMYAGDYKRKEGGKKLEFFEFAIIWLSKDGKSRKIATSDRALVEFKEPMGVMKPGAAPHVVQAKLEGNVWLRDDKGTPADRSDDLVVSGPDGGLPWIEYTEKTNPPEIRSVSSIKVVDQNLTLTGYNLLIWLRKEEGPGAAAGFEAQTAFLDKDPRIHIKDVGKSGGNVFGSPRQATTSGPTPLDLRADGKMRIDLPRKPKRLRPDQQGPPEYEGPTFARFERNVEVERGRINPDVMTSEALALTLFPVDKPVTITPNGVGPLALLGLAHHLPGAGGAYPHSGKDSTDGPLGDLDLRAAKGTGYAVWITSETQGVKARCNELIYKKAIDGSTATSTYLRADRGKQVSVEKLEREGTPADPGPVKSFTTFVASEFTIHDDGRGNSASTVIARGAGSYLERPDRDRSVEHSATWRDEMVTQALPLDPVEVAAARRKGEGPPQPRRLITLTGDPVMNDHGKDTKITAAEWIKITMAPSAAAKAGAGPKPATSGNALGTGSSRVERVQARRDVVLTTPGKTARARESLDAPFEELVVAPPPPPDPNAPPPPPAPVVVEAEPVKADPGPETTILADRIWAKVLQLPGGKADLIEARLRGGVAVDQAGTVEKPRGTHAKGEAMDVVSVGKGLMKFKSLSTDPSALTDNTRLAALGSKRLVPRPYSTIQTDDYFIAGPNIGLDQSNDFAWVNGPGQLVQMAERGFLSDKGLRERKKALSKMTDEERKKEASKKEPLTIVWSENMRFNGRSADPDGNPAGKAEFYGNVVATTEEQRMGGDELRTWTDRPVSLVPPRGSRPKGGLAGGLGGFDQVVPVAANSEDLPRSAGSETDEPKPELARVEVKSRSKWVAGDIKQGVHVVTIRRDEITGEVVEKQYLEGQEVHYNKRTGNYSVPDAGIVRIWKRQVVEDKATHTAAKPVSGRPRDAEAAKPAKPPVYGPSWELTKIQFKDGMRGRLGMAKDEEDPETRTADFYGAVKAVNGRLSDDSGGSAMNRDHDFDNRRQGSKYITADALRIVDVPPSKAEKAKGAQARQYMTAEDNAQTRDDTHNITADILTYDTQKGQFWAFGKDGRPAEMNEQKRIGHGVSRTPGSALRYNKDGSFEVIDPASITLYEGQGIRPSIAPLPAGPLPKIKPKRPPLRPPPRSNSERRDFRGS
jgi:hypothetical protein